MTPVQSKVIGLCFCLSMLVGMGVLSISLVAPVLSNEWDIPSDTLGVVFAAAMLGMMLGAIIIAPLADRIGRRKQIMVCLLVLGVGMLATAMTTSITQLTLLRFITGLSLGGLIPSMITMPSEFSPIHSRNFLITTVQAGYPLGIVILGLIAAQIIQSMGWQSIFILPGMLSLIALPMVALYMPESLDFLMNKQPVGALVKINATLRRMGHEQLEALPDINLSGQHQKIGISSLFSQEYRRSTLLLWTAFFMCFCTLFVLLSWIPQLTANTGLSIKIAIYASATLNVGAVFGMITLGYLADRIGLRRVVLIWLIFAAVLLATFGFIESPLMLMLSILLIGFTVEGGFIGLFATGAKIYPTLIRNTGIGLASGIARLGSIVGPYVTGILVLNGFSIGDIFFVFAFPMLLTAFAIYLIRTKQTIAR